MKDIFLLDMDETLLDFIKAEQVNFFWALGKHGIAAEGGMYARFHEINDGLWKLLEVGKMDRETLKRERFRLLFEEYGLMADCKAVSDSYFENFTEICFPYAGAREFLRELSRYGRVFITTNGSMKIQRRHIELAGFTPYLCGVFISEEVGADKPSWLYVEAVKKGIADFDPARAVYVGDSLTSDMICAERLGVDFLLYARRAPEGYQGLFASTFDEALKTIFK